jgi:hypothetical protein
MWSRPVSTTRNDVLATQRSGQDDEAPVVSRNAASVEQARREAEERVLRRVRTIGMVCLCAGLALGVASRAALNVRLRTAAYRSRMIRDLDRPGGVLMDVGVALLEAHSTATAPKR